MLHWNKVIYGPKAEAFEHTKICKKWKVGQTSEGMGASQSTYKSEIDVKMIDQRQNRWFLRLCRHETAIRKILVGAKVKHSASGILGTAEDALLH
jgi:hypothetical protein